MRARELIFESPQLVEPIDADITKRHNNAAYAKELFDKKSEVFDDNADFVLFRTGDQKDGYIVLIDKKNHLINYLVKYQRLDFKWINEPVCQVLLWRRQFGDFVQGMTRQIFFTILLHRYPAVISDEIQTEDGRDFWKERLVEASNSGYSVGLVDVEHQSVTWFKKEDGLIQDWIKQNNHWGAADEFRTWRYLISK